MCTECPGSSSRPAPALHSQHEEKEKAFKEQLAHLASLLPTLQVGPGWVTHPLECQARLCAEGRTDPREAAAVTPLCTGPPGDLLSLPELRQQSRVPRPGLCESC